jgi:hypothetical protein
MLKNRDVRRELVSQVVNAVGIEIVLKRIPDENLVRIESRKARHLVCPGDSAFRFEAWLWTAAETCVG